jgi:hypothetical protein
MKKLLFAYLAITITCAAQGQVRERFLSLSAGGGLHQLRYQLDNGSSKGCAGFSLNAGYSIYFSKNWGVSSGIGLHSLRTEGTLNHTTTTTDIDSEDDNYEFRTYYKGWKEEQKTLLIDIPLTATFRHTLTPKLGLMVDAGAMLSIPVSATYKAVGGTISTTGYYSRWDVELSDLPEQGFHTFISRPTGDLSLRPALSLCASLGGTYLLTESISLYADTYASYGLNSMLKSGSKPIFQKDGTYNSLLNSSQAGKVRAATLGLTLGVRWSLTR